MDIFFKYALIVLISLIGFFIFSSIVASWCVFSIVLCRGNKQKWAREQTDIIPEKQAMYKHGTEWCKQHKNICTPVHIQNDGLNLYGEYYDFGFDKCVMILLGRSECYYDSFYYVDPYINKGFNVLTVDSRAHGLSDGKYHTFGFEESKDYLKWAEFLHEQYGIKHIVFHGICVGASAGLFAMTSKDCPDYIDALIGEGMHIRVFETIKNHLKVRKKPVYPTIYFIDMWNRLLNGHTIKKGPIDIIDKYDKPLLMLHSKQDKFSLPHLAEKLYNACPSKQKKLVLFDKGNHSLVREANAKEYDKNIEEFLDSVYSDAKATV